MKPIISYYLCYVCFGKFFFFSFLICFYPPFVNIGCLSVSAEKMTEKGVCTTEQVFTPERSTEAQNQLNGAQRIAHGVKTSIKKVPYMAAVVFLGDLVCGAGIVTPRMVVSAAHCYYEIKVLTGLRVRVASDYYFYGDFRDVIKVKLHPQFDFDTGANDCAVLKVGRSFSRRFPYQELSISTKSPQLGDILLVAGWGQTYEGGLPSSYLLSGNVTVQDNFICDFYLEKVGKAVPYTGFCAADFIGGKNPCKGDGGGPAVRENLLVGIVSYGGKCGQPVVYTDVATVSQWLKRQIRRNLWWSTAILALIYLKYNQLKLKQINRQK